MLGKQQTILPKVIPSIDLVKMISALLIVTVHVSPRAFDDLMPGVDYIITSVFARAALMVFFITGGFFLAKSSAERGNSAIVKYFIRLLTVYTIWTLIYSYSAYIIPTCQGLITVQTAIKNFIINYLFLGYLQLWFFPAILISVICFYIFKNLKLLRLWWFMAIPLGAIGLLGISYRAIGRLTPLEPFFQSAAFSPLRRIFFMGMPVFILGTFVYYHLDKLMKIPKKATDILAVIACMLFVLEPALLAKYNINDGLIITLFLYPFVFFLLLACIRNPMERHENKSLSWRYYSSGIYYCHYLFIHLFQYITATSQNYASIDFTIAPTVQYLLVIGFSFGFVYIIKTINNKHLMRLIY